MNKAVLELRDVRVAHDGRDTLAVPHLEVMLGETLGVIGPNGAGKSTLLRVLALLQRPDEGELYMGGRRVNLGGDLLPYRRRLAIVFQEALLLNASVYDNAAMGLRFRGTPKQEAAKKVDFWLERLGIAHLRARAARTLSGGEAQRVSLARALSLEPEVLLLDEPFSALDAPTRIDLIDDLERILAETPMTTVFVTHDRGEALALCDRLAVMIDGRIEQIDGPNEVFSSPASEDVAAFVGVDNIIPGCLEAQSGGLAHIRIGEALMIQAVSDWQAGQRVLVLLRPEDVTLTLWDGEVRPSSARNALRGVISRLMPLGPLARVVVDCGFPLVVLITHQSLLDMGLAPGVEILASFKATAIHLIRKD
ncbi:MAG: ABC transporter ATP-binding protein [Dehalococcoidales bacterium]|nr:ABC transporter ATP-binding protein [Dehalococcoidales bacterium]